MFQEQLQNFGLTKAQSEVLNYLLEHGEAKASQIGREIRHPRGVVYKALEELIGFGMAEKREKEGKVAIFYPAHPKNIEKILEERERELNQSKKTWESLLPQLVSSYNLASNKPGISFFEGEEGFKKILYDTLSSKTEVYLFMNNDAVSQEPWFKEINKNYVEKRIHAGIKKKILEAGEKPEITFGTSNDKYDSITEIRYLKKTLSLFKTSIHIYDGKVSYQTIDGEKIIGILIEDKNIYEANKAWFEMVWEASKE